MSRAKRRYNGQARGEQAAKPIASADDADRRNAAAVERFFRDVLVNEPPKDPDPPQPRKPKRKR